jgi:predicted transcriptional regulator
MVIMDSKKHTSVLVKRLKKHVKQEPIKELADRSGVHWNTIYKYISGERSPQFEQASLLITAMDSFNGNGKRHA